MLPCNIRKNKGWMRMKETVRAFKNIIRGQLQLIMEREIKRRTISPEAAAYICNLIEMSRSLSASEISSHTQQSTADAGDINNDLQDELEGAQKYLNRYKSTGDKDYLRMSREELSHAEKFLTELQKNEPTGIRFNNAFAEFNKLKSELSSHYS